MAEAPASVLATRHLRDNAILRQRDENLDRFTNSGSTRTSTNSSGGLLPLETVGPSLSVSHRRSATPPAPQPDRCRRPDRAIEDELRRVDAPPLQSRGKVALPAAIFGRRVWISPAQPVPIIDVESERDYLESLELRARRDLS